MWMNIFIGLGALMISVVIQVLAVLWMLRYLGQRSGESGVSRRPGRSHRSLGLSAFSDRRAEGFG